MHSNSSHINNKIIPNKRCFTEKKGLHHLDLILHGCWDKEAFCRSYVERGKIELTYRLWHMPDCRMWWQHTEAYLHLGFFLIGFFLFCFVRFFWFCFCLCKHLENFFPVHYFKTALILLGFLKESFFLAYFFFYFSVKAFSFTFYLDFKNRRRKIQVKDRPCKITPMNRAFLIYKLNNQFCTLYPYATCRSIRLLLLWERRKIY